MLLVAALIAAVLTAGSPAPAQKPPTAEESADRLPKHFETYGKENTAALLGSCFKAGANRFTKESLESFCFCHVYVLEEVIPFPDLHKMDPGKRSDLFVEIAKQCAELGAKPAPLPPKAAPPAPPPGQTEL